jgi:hypothetical protein
MRPLRTGLDTRPAADAFILIDHPNIAVLSIHMRGSDRTILDAER